VSGSTVADNARARRTASTRAKPARQTSAPVTHRRAPRRETTTTGPEDNGGGRSGTRRAARAELAQSRAPRGQSTSAKSTETASQPSEQVIGQHRFRERRVAIARASGRRRLYLLLGFAGVLALFIAAMVLLHSSVFSARAIAVSGARATSVQAIEQVSGLAQHPPLIDINATALARKIESLPWIKDARVATHWPDGVSVQVKERVAIAAANVGVHRYVLIDPTGRVLAVAAAPPKGLIGVKLGRPDALVPGRQIASFDRPLLELSSAMPDDLVASIALVSDDADHNLLLTLKNKTRVVFGSSTNLQQKLIAFATLSANHAILNEKVIDLRVPSAPVLTP
jgi:cell division protein FtsQ